MILSIYDEVVTKLQVVFSKKMIRVKSWKTWFPKKWTKNSR